MPYDGIVLSGAVWEINGLLSGGRIERVFQTGRYEITLLCHSHSEKYRLLIQKIRASILQKAKKRTL